MWICLIHTSQNYMWTEVLVAFDIQILLSIFMLEQIGIRICKVLWSLLILQMDAETGRNTFEWKIRKWSELKLTDPPHS